MVQIKELAEVIGAKHAFPVSARESGPGRKQQLVAAHPQEELNSAADELNSAVDELNSAVDGQKRQRRWEKEKDDDHHSEAKWWLTLDGRK